MSPATRSRLSVALLMLAEESHSAPVEGGGTDGHTKPTGKMVAVTLRMLAGAALEAVARHQEGTTSTDSDPDSESHDACCQLWADAAHVAVWTSAHAECVCALQRQGFLIADPCVSHVPCFLSESDLTDMFSRRMDARANTKETEPLRQLLQRATSPGQRGWDTVMDQALKKEGMASVMRDSVAVCLLGLHTQLPPRARVGWRERKVIMCLMQQTLYRARGANVLIKCPVAVKESLRRRIAATMHISAAEHAALSALKHPVRHLLVPPCALPVKGQLAAMKAFARAGRMLTNVTSEDPLESLAHVINESFNRCIEAEDAPRFELSWLGRGTISVKPRLRLMGMASAAWSLAFRANFLPFWTFCTSHNLRASRLDGVQHESVHSLNSATRLCALLREQRALRAQRAVLRMPSAALLTPQEAARLMGLSESSNDSSSARPTSVAHATEILRVDGGGTAEGVAMLLSFARVAAVTESVLTYDLGERVARLQARALLRRFVHPDARTAAESDLVRIAETQLPKHAAYIHLCCECRRLATAHVGIYKARTSGQAFNEIGVSACMSHRDAMGCTEMRCAKRSSAALRTALSFEVDMQLKSPERLAYNAEAVMGVLTKRGTESTGTSARIRRDAKSAFEQNSVPTPCGKRPMLVLPLLGKAVRVFNEWVAMCTLCGSVLIVRPQHRYGCEIACMRCDPGMLYTPEEVVAAAKTVEKREGKVCRFCGRVDPERSGQRWRTLNAPLDVAGINAGIPPPLRRCHYCPRHFRGWLRDAHMTLETRCILSHIVTGARPIHGAETGSRPTTSTDTRQSKNTARKRRRIPKASKK